VPLRLLLFLTLASAQTTVLELRALTALYNSTGGPGWFTPWNLGTDPCIANWPGVRCRPIGNNEYNIWSLVVQSNNLRGTIPTEIGYLLNVQFLYLSGNFLSGSIPAEIGGLRQLVQVGFDKNQLTGNFPPDLSQLTMLQIVYLQDNQITGSLLPFTKLPAIQYLWFSRNRLVGTLPEELGNLSTLQQIGVDVNQLTGPIPTGFGVRQALMQAFYGQANYFAGPFPNSLCRVSTCDLSGGGNLFSCPLPTPSCCHVTTCQ